MNRLFHLTALSLALGLSACGAGSEQAPPAATATQGAAPLPDPAEAGLVTPEEAAEQAQEEIDATNAGAELERLQREIGGG
jgi:hypothetical protein